MTSTAACVPEMPTTSCAPTSIRPFRARKHAITLESRASSSPPGPWFISAAERIATHRLYPSHPCIGWPRALPIVPSARYDRMLFVLPPLGYRMTHETENRIPLEDRSEE